MAWTRKAPTLSGLYWIASLEGKMAGTYRVRVSLSGEVLSGGGKPIVWEGWWWDEAIEPPPINPPRSASLSPEPTWRKIEDMRNPEFPRSINPGELITYGKTGPQ